ncbi:adenosine receptor A1-like [Saccoglossus kowalevskii]|uniref:Adenosine receptor A1-like n=1 Tax=Saccoglossus kowalevskii TaxID=10224 RepID=A0ABM0MHZ9_SACKO|nr:PREDICTED: adenosine receptor A1-like [Saccoglossus kowalevskii]
MVEFKENSTGYDVNYTAPPTGYPGPIISMPGVVVLATASVAVSLINILVITAVVVNRNLHSASNYFYASLTIAGVFIGLITIPINTWLFATFPVSQTYWTCTGMTFMQMVGLMSFVLNMLVTSFDKYYQLVHPFSYQKVMTSRKAVITSSVTWGIALLYSSAPLLGWNNVALNRQTSGCLFRYVATFEYICLTHYGIVVPCTVAIVYFNSKIICVAKQEARKIRAQKVSVTRRNDFRTGRKSTVALLIMLGMLLVGWLPFLVVVQVSAMCQHCVTDSSISGLALLALASTAIGPMTYGLRQEDYRKTMEQILIKLFCGWYCRTPPIGQRTPSNV